MSPTSLGFILFFALTAAVYFCLPMRARPACLLAASLVFYAFAGVEYLPFLLLSALTSYLAARFGGKKSRVLAVLFHIGLLFLLKYFNFFSAAAGGPALQLIVPVGLSFYTFTVIGYLTDVGRGVCAAEKSFARYLLFVSFFPHILQGPIDRYGDCSASLFAPARFDGERVVRGLWRMAWGFFEKLVIADRLGILVSGVWEHPESFAGWRVAAAVVCYALQIYCDFAGYMDIALGASEIFGIRLAENFDTPYFSRTVPEFWRRWHVSLGAWFKDYVFFTLQRTVLFRRMAKALRGRGLRRAAKQLPAALALAAVWLLTGLWHGAGWNYIAWGAYYGLLIILSMLLEAPLAAAGKRLRLKGCIWEGVRVLRTFALVCLGYVLFRSASLGEAGQVLSRICTAPFAAGSGFSATGFEAADLAVLIPALALRLWVSLCRLRGGDARDRLCRLPVPLRMALGLCLVMSVMLFGVWGPGYDASSFIYFQY